MKTAQYLALSLLGTTLSVSAAISVLPDDVSTAAQWRTAAAYDVDGDEQYGTDGYLLYGWYTPPGLYLTDFDASTFNSDNQWAMPDYVGDVATTTGNRLWSGSAGGNYGMLQDPADPNNTQQAAVLLAASGNNADPIILTLTRADDRAFRLTLIFGGGDGGGHPKDAQRITIDAGSAGSASATHIGYDGVGVSYKSFDIDAGTDAITLTISGEGAGDNTHLTGLAFDSEGGQAPVVAPLITRQPAGGTALAGNSFTLVVEVTGTAPLYQWLKDNAPIAGATGATLRLDPVKVEDAGTYTVQVSNSAGQITSDPALLEVIPASTVNFVGTDTDTQASWRTSAVAKPLDVDGDNVYGSDGWVIYSYTFKSYQGVYDINTTRASLPPYITSVSAPPLAWGGGDDANFGVVDDPLDPGSTRNATHGLSPGGSTLSLTITRATDRAFRLAVLLGNHPPFAFEEDITVNAGGEAMVRHVGSQTDPLAVYHLFDIGSGLAPVTVMINNNNSDNPGVMGFAFDNVAGPTPRLSIVRNGNQVTIYWDASLAGWTLESASELPATSWLPVPGVTGNSITLNLEPSNAFYRLRK